MFSSRLISGKSLRLGAIAAATTLATYHSVFQNTLQTPISLDAKKESINDQYSVSIPKSGVDPIPLKVNYSTAYDLLGYGSRYVTFLNFRVYTLGLYIATEDVNKIPTVLDSKYLSQTFIDTDPTKPHEQNVLEALKDKEKSKILISNFLDSNVRLLARITPVRNTDFGHLKDGLVKSIMASGVKDEALADGLQELRGAFQRNGSVPKNHNLILERLESGDLQIYYESVAKGKEETVEIGKVTNPIVSKLLFLQYLSGGLSPDARDTAVEKMSQLV